MALLADHDHDHDHNGISLTGKAAARLAELQEIEGILIGNVRISVEKGFCGEGYDYVIDFVAGPSEGDEIYYSQGIEIYSPREQLDRLFGCIIDFDPNAAGEQFNNLLKKGLVVYNPNSKGACPCMCNRGFDF